MVNGKWQMANERVCQEEIEQRKEEFYRIQFITVFW